MWERPERAQAFRDTLRRHTGFVHREGAGQCIGDVVIAEQMELVTFQQGFPTKAERPCWAVVRGVGARYERKQHRAPGKALRVLQHQWIVGVEDPDVLGPSVPEEQPLI